jgi:hypothetical protein
VRFSPPSCLSLMGCWLFDCIGGSPFGCLSQIVAALGEIALRAFLSFAALGVLGFGCFGGDHVAVVSALLSHLVSFC